jgi:hypothetical protein
MSTAGGGGLEMKLKKSERRRGSKAKMILLQNFSMRSV